MSKREEKFLALAELGFEDISVKGLQESSSKILKTGVHGLCFSPYLDGQGPGDLAQERWRPAEGL